MIGLDLLMFLEPFGLLPMLGCISESMRHFIPAYKSTRIIVEVLIESLPQCLLQSYIFVTVVQHVRLGTASAEEQVLMGASIEGSAFIHLLPRSIAISSITMLKAWIELVLSAREAGISVRTKAKQLLHVGFGLPLDALIRGTILEWSCGYRLADGEVHVHVGIRMCMCMCSSAARSSSGRAATVSHVHVGTRARGHVGMRACVHVCTCACVHVGMRACGHECACARVHVGMCARVHLRFDVCTCARVHVCTAPPPPREGPARFPSASPPHPFTPRPLHTAAPSHRGLFTPPPPSRGLFTPPRPPLSPRRVCPRRCRRSSTR